MKKRDSCLLATSQLFLFINCLIFLGFVPGTTSVRKIHQIPVDSLVSYLQNELGLHQRGEQ